jgi:hypothetical protein
VLDILLILRPQWYAIGGCGGIVLNGNRVDHPKSLQNSTIFLLFLVTALLVKSKMETCDSGDNFTYLQSDRPRSAVVHKGVKEERSL